jgi:DNA gyrase subunit A
MEQVTALVLAKDTSPGLFMVIATSRGIIKRTSMDKFASVRSSGLIAMKLVGEEELVGASVLSESDKVMLVSQNGKAIRFAIKDLRIASRTSGGVRGIRLDRGDKVVGMSKVFTEARLLTVTENGFGKLSRVNNYPLQNRGGKGVIAHKVNEKTGKVIAAMTVPISQNLIIISAKGIVIRISIDDEVPVQGRPTQGVHLNRLDEDDKVASISYLGEAEDVGEDKTAGNRMETSKEVSN